MSFHQSAIGSRGYGGQCNVLYEVGWFRSLIGIITIARDVSTFRIWRMGRSKVLRVAAFKFLKERKQKT